MCKNFSVFSHPVKTYKACISLTGHDIKNDGAVKREKKFRTVQKRKIHLGERDTDAEIRLHIFKFICQDFFTRLFHTVWNRILPLHTTLSVHFLILVHPYILTHSYETCDSWDSVFIHFKQTKSPTFAGPYWHWLFCPLLFCIIKNFLTVHSFSVLANIEKMTISRSPLLFC